MNYLKHMLSSSKDVSYGRIVSFLCLLFVMGICISILLKMKDPSFPAVDPFWRDIILGLYGISKTGDTVEAFKKGAADGR